MKKIKIAELLIKKIKAKQGFIIILQFLVIAGLIKLILTEENDSARFFHILGLIFTILGNILQVLAVIVKLLKNFTEGEE